MGEGWEGALEGVGPENRDFFGPEMASSENYALKNYQCSCLWRLDPENRDVLRALKVQHPAPYKQQIH